LLLKVLVLGSGGREHALAWIIQKSPRCEKVFLHPGNAGTEKEGFSRLGSLTVEPTETFANALKKENISLVVIGPEAYLAVGLADYLRNQGFLVLGPNQKAAQLECSKVFAKEFMQRAKIPTAPFLVIEGERALKQLARERRSYPVVLKLDGLAAGKGVVIAKSSADIEDFTTRIFHNQEFGKGPHSIVIEEFIPGKELSYIGLCDGEVFLPLATSSDYKRVYDANLGPNTGGMGAISPSPLTSPTLEKKIKETILDPILLELKNSGLDYCGALYIGLMLDENNEPFVLEFNTRFGDPETQALMLRWESDALEVFFKAARKQLKDCPPLKWSAESSLYVVATADGYPGTYTQGDVISGVDSVLSKDKTFRVFYSGVKGTKENLTTGGGRVLGIGTTASTLEKAREKIYSSLPLIHFRGIHYRKDIGII
jgi:phosphoribosylamine--glycine ligase